MAGDNLNELYRDRQKILAEISRLKKDINTFEKEGIDDVKKQRDLNVQRKQLAQGLFDTNKLIQDQQRRFYVDAQKAATELSGIHSNLGRIDHERIQMMLETSGLTQDTINKTNKIAELNREISQLSVDDTIQRQILNDEVEHLLQRLEEERGISSEILDNLKKQSNVAYGLSKMSEQQIEQEESKFNILDKIRNTVSNTLGIGEEMFDTVPGRIGAMLVGVGLLAGRFGDIRRELGGIESSSATIMSYFDSDAVGTFRELSNQFGSIDEASLGTQINTSLMARTMGISGQEAATLVGEFARLNDGSSSMAQDLMSSTQEFAKQRGVIPAQVMSDLAGSTEAFAKFGRDGGRNLAEAAVYARQLGTEFSTLEGLASNLLDFESSINSELELSAVLGRRVNLDRARALAFQGEIEEATRETLNALGGINAWEGMNVIERQQAAEALGLQVGQLDKMIKNQETAGTQSELIGERFSRWGSTLDAFVNEALGTTVTALGAGLTTVGQWSHGLMGISKLMEALKLKQLAIWAVEKMRLGWAKLKTVFAAKELGIAKTRLATEKAITATQQKGAMGGKGGIGGMMKGLNPTVMLKGAAAIAILAGSLFIFGKALQEFQDVGWDELQTAIVGLTSLTAAAIALGFAGKFVLIGAAAIGVLAGSIWVLGKGLQEMAVGIQMMSSLGVVISDLISQTSGIMKLTGSLFSLAAGLSAVGLAGMVSLPGLMAVQVATSVVERVTGGDEGNLGNESIIQENHDELITEIRGLRHDLQSGKIAVYMDRDKVSRNVADGINESKVNRHGLL